MSELVRHEIIEKLEERHERLIVELDRLNERLEKALNSFVKPVQGPVAGNDKIRMPETQMPEDKALSKSEA